MIYRDLLTWLSSLRDEDLEEQVTVNLSGSNSFVEITSVGFVLEETGLPNVMHPTQPYLEAVSKDSICI